MHSWIKGIVAYFRVEHAIVLIPVCSFAVFDSAFSAFSSVLAMIGDQFPDVPVVVIQMVLSIPSLLSIPAMLLSGFLASYVRKRSIGLVALAILFVGGMIPVLFRAQSIYILFASSALIGIAQGLMHPLASAIICEGWSGKQRGKVLGFKQAANYVGAAVVALVVGYLALTGWSNAYLVYLAVIPVFLITIFRLPRGGLERKLINREDKAQGLKELFTPKVVYLLLLFMMAALFSFSFHSNIAMMVGEKGMGTSADVSKITSLNYLVAFVLGITYGKLSGVMKDRTLTFGFAVLALGLLIASFSSSFAMLMIGGVLFGFGSGIQEVSTIYYLSNEAEKRATMAMSLGLVFVNIGITFSPLVITALKTTLLSSSSAAAGMLVGAAGFALLAGVELLYRNHMRKSKPSVKGEGE